MWTTLAVAAALILSPAQAPAGKLSVANVRPTLGMLGAPRNSDKVAPGDVFWVAYDLENIQPNAAGDAVFVLDFELLDGKGKSMFKNEGKKDQPEVSRITLGGNRLTQASHADIGLDTAPGLYTMRVTITDATAKATAVMTKNFEVLPVGFNLVQVTTAADPQGQVPAPMVGVPGQIIYGTVVVVGFERDKAKNPNVAVEMTITDTATGKAVTAKPEKATVDQENKVPETARGLPLAFPLVLNRPGKYQVALKATDLLSKKTATAAYPLTVVGADK
jgi:hypothetical protein